MLQIGVVDVGREGVVVGGIEQEMEQVAAHQRLVVADRGQHRLVAEILLQVGGVLLALERLHEFRLDVDDVLGQLEIFEEPLGVRICPASDRAPAGDTARGPSASCGRSGAS